MDDSFKDLEDELKGLQLRRPSAPLLARLERELAEEMPDFVPAPPVRPRYTSATNLGSWKWSGWRLAGMAAAVALVCGVSVITFQKNAATSDPDATARFAANPVTDPDSIDAAPLANTYRYQPVAATNVLYDVKDEGYVRGDDDTSARRVRARYVDTYEWKNPKGNASLKWSVPRDEVRVIPASWN